MKLDRSMIVLLLIQQGASPYEVEEVLDVISEIPVAAPIGAYVFQVLVDVRTKAHQQAMEAKYEQTKKEQGNG
jgi:hypothetical protein